MPDEEPKPRPKIITVGKAAEKSPQEPQPTPIDTTHPFDKPEFTDFIKK